MSTAVVQSTTMRAVVHERFGVSAGLALREVERPDVADDGVLVHVRVASVNRVDWYSVAGRPYIGRPMMGLRKPKSPLIGGDFAGVVEAVGKDVTQFQPGDEVFGLEHGALAEYVSVRDAVEAKPAELTFEEAAAVPLAALTALQGLRDHGQVRAGQNVLINGAGGGVGTFAVQIAKALGATVTAVCSTRNVELVRSLGADRVIDYGREDFTRSGERYDVMFDNAGNRSWSASRRVLAKEATVVLVGGSMTNRLLGPLGHIIRSKLGALRCSQKAVFFIAKPNNADMAVLRELIETGKIRPVIDRRYELREIADAIRYMGEGHTQGKVVITL
jgi:NADPH:quinone reductase-like Zn-dependent oxidoreductase